MGGLDTIRFFSALWVVLYHGCAPPLFAAVNRDGPTMRILSMAYETFFNGQAGVILFFIISGFCIHHPQMRNGRLHVPSFYARRLLRIAIPWGVMEGCIRLWGSSGMMTAFFHMISWTLQCEMIYYIAYPLLLRVAKKRGWAWIFSAAYAVSFLLIALFMPHKALCGTGKLLLNSAIGLPSWLLGCLLAENFSKKPDIAIPPIWLCRVSIWAASAVCFGLMQHTPIGLPWSLNCFALLGYCYVYAEISHCQTVSPSRVLESFGAASYSMYLTHLFVVYLLQGFFHGHSAGIPWLHWGVLISAIFAVTSAWYFTVEFPAHQLARKFRPPVPVQSCTGLNSA